LLAAPRWNARTLAEAGGDMKFLTHTSGFQSVAYTRGGALYSSSADGRVWAWDGVARRLQCVFAASRPVKPAWGAPLWGAVPSPDGRWLLVRGGDNDVLLRVGPAGPLAEANRAGDRFPSGWEARELGCSFRRAPRFTADSGLLTGEPASSEPDPRALFWDLETFERGALPIPDNWRDDYQPWGSGRALIAVLNDRYPLFDVVSLDLAGSREPTHHGTFPDLTHRIRVCRTDWLVVPGFSTVRLLRPSGSGFEVASECKDRSSLTALMCMYDWAVSPDGRRLLTQFRGEVALWDTETGRELGSWDWQIGTVNGVAFAPDGLTAAAAGSRKKLVVWDLED
jgi:hypothetical protein